MIDNNARFFPIFVSIFLQNFLTHLTWMHKFFILSHICNVSHGNDKLNLIYKRIRIQYHWCFFFFFLRIKV